MGEIPTLRLARPEPSGWGPLPCLPQSTLIATIRSSGTGSSPTRPPRRVNRWPGGPRGGSAFRTGGGVCSASPGEARPAGSGRAVNDVFSGRIVGYSIDSRMRSRLAVTALYNAVGRRGDVAGCIVHTDRGSQGGFNWSTQHFVVRAIVGDGSSPRPECAIRALSVGAY